MNTVLREDTLRSPELCERAGITYKQLDYWTRAGLLEVSRWRRWSAGEVPEGGSGSQRVFEAREVAVARFLDLVVPLQATPRSRLSRDRVCGISEFIRLGGRGKIQLVRGVTVDLDVICETSNPEE